MRCGAVDRETFLRKLADRPGKQTDMCTIYEQFFVHGLRQIAGRCDERPEPVRKYCNLVTIRLRFEVFQA